MKKLVTASDIKNLISSGRKSLCFEPGTIITPSAKDLAAELGVVIESGPRRETAPAACPTAPPAAEPADCIAGACGTAAGANEISPALIAQIVREVLASVPGIQAEGAMVKEEDPSGLRLIRGSTVNCESFNTGNPRDKVGIKEILNIKESPNMATGFMTIEESSFSWDLKYEEMDYIIEGTLEMTVNGKTYRGQAGDVFYLPSNATVTFSSPDKCKFFFVTYPANWAELSDYQK